MSYPKQVYIPVPDSQAPPVGTNHRSSNDEVLLNAIRMNNLELCRATLAKDSEILHRKGWNNSTPLHQACLSGQIAIVQFLIENGANPNAPNSFDETPLHYACRRGVVGVVHFMIKHKADVYLVDKKGRNCLHFAALNGNVTMLHYLHTFTELNFETPDSTGRNILHVAVEMWHIPAVSYLTRHNRVDPSLKDLRGVTPLHIAVEKRFGNFIWTLLNAGGCELLKIQNQNGESPLDLARQGSSPSQVGMFKALSKYNGCSGPPRGPIYVWYFLLTFSFLFPALIFFLSSYMNGYGGHLCFVMLVVLVHISLKQSHRIEHLCRWPNPWYLGVFVGGILHCSIAEFGYLFPTIWPCPFAILLTAIFAGICIFLLVFLIFGDPGIDKEPMWCDTFQRPMTMLDLAEGRVPEAQFCPYTEEIHGFETKYCKLCERPILKLDHHCLFLNTCVAVNNHKHFIMLLIGVMILQLSFIYASMQYMRLMNIDIHNFGLGDPLSPFLIYLYKENPWIFFLMFLCVFTFAWIGILVYAQLSLVMRGTTTYRNLKNMNHGPARLTKMKMFHNLVKFFTRPRYSKAARSAPMFHA